MLTINRSTPPPTFPPSKNDYLYSVEHFTSIKNAGLHVVLNTHILDGIDTLEILYAMLNHKPIIMLNSPIFANSVDMFTKNLITSRLNKIFLCNIEVLDENDRAPFLSNLFNIDINYTMTRQEQVLARAKIRSYFRTLLSKHFS